MVSAAETAYHIKKNRHIRLSEQNLVDCDRRSNACSGGLINSASDYMKNTGIALNENYKYTAKKGVCKPKEGTLTKIASYRF